MLLTDLNAASADSRPIALLVLSLQMIPLTFSYYAKLPLSGVRNQSELSLAYPQIAVMLRATVPKSEQYLEQANLASGDLFERFCLLMLLVLSWVPQQTELVCHVQTSADFLIESPLD